MSTENEVNPLEDKLLEIVTQMQSGIETGILFGQEQIPEVMEQLLRYDLISNGILGGLFVLLLSVFTYLYVYLIKLYPNPDSGEQDTIIFLTIAYVIGGIILLYPTWGYLSTAFKIYIAPKVYLLEYITDLTQKLS